MVDRGIDHSIPFGTYDGDGAQVGFARVVTDRCTFAWLACTLASASSQLSFVLFR